MPLHLLGKKSWNVYNSDNVERVRRDEAAAQAREEAEEQRMQEADAVRRIAILRGEEPPAIDPPPSARDRSPNAAEGTRSREHASRKRRRLRGEDDTERDIRYAREDAEAGEQARRVLLKGKDGNDAPLIDHAGHLQLIPAPDDKEIRRAEKNAEAEAEKAKKRKRDEDQYTMRFSNAAGFNNGMAQPWYAAKASSESTPQAGSDAKSTALVLPHVQDRDAWGNDDPLRKERERSRISSSDPFAAMQQAQRQLKQSERDKDKWQKERDVDLEQLKRSQERKRRHERERRHPREHDRDSLEGFSLDAAGKDDREKNDRHRHHHHRHRRHRSRSRSTSRDRHRISKHRPNEG